MIQTVSSVSMRLHTSLSLTQVVGIVFGMSVCGEETVSYGKKISNLYNIEIDKELVTKTFKYIRLKLMAKHKFLYFLP